MNQLTPKEIMELKAKILKLYTGKRYAPTPFEFSMYKPIVPRGSLGGFRHWIATHRCKVANKG